MNEGEDYKTYDTAWGCTYPSNITMDSSKSVGPNHYGSSDLRMALKGMTDGLNTTYFTIAEQGLMNATTVTTKDKMNEVSYTTTDKLYALHGAENDDYKKIWAGSGDSTVLAKSSFWSSEESYLFWLRSPGVCEEVEYDQSVADTYTGGCVFSGSPYHGIAVQPASNLNLSSVLFASAATAASSDTAVSGTIVDGTAMTLRLNGSDTAIGTVIYDESTGEIAAQKDVNAAGTVSLVVQGNDGTNDWYYSVPVDKPTFVKAEDIKNAVTSLSTTPDLADCNIWIETTIDNVSYAKMAEMVDIITVVTVNGVIVSGMDAPVGGKKFDTEAYCGTTGIANTAPAITYTIAGENGDVDVTGNADWNTTYKAKVTLATGIVDDVVYVFGNSVSCCLAH